MFGDAPRTLFLVVALLAAALLSGCTGRTDDNALFIGKGTASFVDATGALGIDEVRARADSLFAPSPPAAIGSLPEGAALWLRIPTPDVDTLLSAGWQRTFSLVVKEAAVHHVDLFVLGADSLEIRSWDWQDSRRLGGNGYRFPLVVVEPATIAGKALLMRIVPERSFTGRVWLSDFQSFFGGYNAETTTLSLTIGFLLAVLIYMLALGSTLEDGTNLWFAAAIGAQLVQIACASAVFETQIMPGAVHLSLGLGLAADFALQAALIGFTTDFLRIRGCAEGWGRLVWLPIGFFGALAVVALFDRDPALRFAAPAAVASFACIALLAAKAATRRNGRATAFTLCWLPALVPMALEGFGIGVPRAFSDNLAEGNGSLFGLCASFALFAAFASLDIRQRERGLLRQVADEAERFRRFAEIGIDGFWEIDSSGRLTFLSGQVVGPARLAVGDVLLDRLAELSSADYTRPIRQMVADGLPFDERRIKIANGERDVWVSLSGRAIGDAGAKNAVAYRGVIRDVTEEIERESRRAVEQQILALGQLVGSVAHEVNNLLHPIVNLTKRLRNRFAGIADAESMRLVELIDLSSRQAAKVVSELLRSTRDQRWSDIQRPISLAVEYSVEAVRPALPASVRIDVVTDEVEQPTVKVGDILQVVGNLLSNAVHAMDGRGHVTVALAGAPEGARLTVSDDGAGMAEDVRRRALQPFFTTKTDGRGSGVGLYVVQKIVQDYGGWIAIDSTPGLGTTFTILFPIRKEDNGEFPPEADGSGRG
ncbi:hypothetical protein GCM10011390_19540 [Aureimonas endophytica]|uniref:histidine kinase n=1 Tax=Aureimonas endophytica TaxID=2027858 RepID=A0A916ZKA3_9HYPH|nr:ATP-binding protein [Aureimonas endophytica]GGE00804.1 hypothetical protein GCM10011390_19540 [Aureimonas endophytica]